MAEDTGTSRSCYIPSKAFEWTPPEYDMSLRVFLVILIFLASQPTLAGVGACDDLGTEPATGSVDFGQDIQPIFNDRCTGCHTAGHFTGLDLQAGASYGLLVNVASSQDGSWLRVDPSSLANSLLFHKINCDDPPVGNRMPIGGPSLSLAEQALIRDWIEQGASDRFFSDRFESLPLPPLPPVSQSGLIDWFNPDHGLFLDGAGWVVEWTNLADESRSTGGSSAATTVAAVNGRRMIRFNSPVEGGHLGYPSPGSQSLAAGYSVFVVFRLNEPIADGHIFPRFWRGANDTSAFFFRRSAGEVEVKADPLAPSARPSHPYANRYGTGNIAILTARLTPTSQELYFNGVMVSSSESPITTYTIDDTLFQIGNSVRGDIADVLVYDHSATLEDLDVTGQALAEAYGTAWPLRDCAECPIMLMIPAGSFTQGSPASEPQSSGTERPQRTVNVSAFAMGQYSVTFDEWDACVADGGCTHNSDDWGLGRGNRPVILVSWDDAQEYVTWLSTKTGHDYRLPSESEWEYATRAGTTGRFNTGDCISSDQANFRGTNPAQDCPVGIYPEQTLPVGSFAPNTFGLYDTHGSVWELVEDCWNENYVGAPIDGGAWMSGDCSRAVTRGGAWTLAGSWLRSAQRISLPHGDRTINTGFRVARSVDP
ncbi:MAG: hypothetical protein EA419_10680 [Wenzhouxiangella sp.]|nr:MAG: hypothetical protein EA419_10680 [Wenzhouxiangella sp.]